MKIWVIEIGEPLPMEKDVRMHRYGQFTAALAKMGHDVTWWTSSFSHAPKKHFAEADSVEMVSGVRLRLIRGPGYMSNVSFARIKHNKHFAARLAELIETVEKPDIIISPIPIIEAADVMIRYGMKRGISVMTDIRDEWPDDLRNLAPAPLRPLAQLMLRNAYRKMRFVCKNATGIMAVATRQVNFGLRFAGRARKPTDVVFPLGYSATSLPEAKLEEGRKWCREQGLCSGIFTVCFFGTIGKYFNLDTVIDAARILEKEFPIKFVLAGDGSALEGFKRRAAGLKSVAFPGWVDAPKIAAIMESSDAGIAPYKSDAAMSMPNKIFEYMAGGLPLVSSIQGELVELLKQRNCGISYHADSVEELCRAIRILKTDETKRAEMGKNARLLLESEFSTEKVFQKISEHLQAVANRSI